MWKSIHQGRPAWLLALMLIAVLVTANRAWAHGGPVQAKVAGLGSSVAVDNKGTLWALSPQAVAEGSIALALRRSDDGGQSWSAPAIVSRETAGARGEERPALALGAKGEIFILYTRPLAGARNPHTGDIRFVRSVDGGKSFSEPVSVHANRDPIVHAFGAMIVDPAGNLYVVWIDSRNKEAAKAGKQAYPGNGLYYAVSTDAGKSFQGDYRIADHTCECCRLSLALNEKQRPVVMWRHIFAPNIRDHATAELGLDGVAGPVTRASFDDWRIDACPHQGPSLAFAADGTRHQSWFTVKENEGGIYYAAVSRSGQSGTPVRLGTGQAKQGEVAVDGKNICVVWKQFDGEATALIARMSKDHGRSWTQKELARTTNDSDRPQLLHTASGVVAAWHTQNEGMRILPVTSGR